MKKRFYLLGIVGISLFSLASCDKSVQVEFRADSGGFISGDNYQKVSIGRESKEVEAIPLEGYYLKAWSDGSTDSKRIISPTEDTKLTAYFSKLIKASFVVDNLEEGYISGDSLQYLKEDSTSEEVQAIAKPGYKFNKWSDGLLNANRTISVSKDNVSVKALFTKLYSISFTVNDTFAGTIKGSTEQYVELGNYCAEVEAIPSNGYIFTGWSDGVMEEKRIARAVDGSLSLQANFVASLPVVEIFTKDYAPIVSKEDYIQSTISISNTTEKYCFSNKEAEIRGRGNSTWHFPKKPYRIKFSEKTSLFGEEANKSWVLLALYQDYSLVKDFSAFKLMDMLETDNFVPMYRHVKLYLNKTYQGMYLLTDQVDENKGRANVKTTISKDKDEVPFLVELDEYAPSEGLLGSEYFDINQPSGTRHYNIKYPEADERKNENQFAYIQNYITTAFNSILNKNDDIEKYIDINSLIDYYLIQEAVMNPEIFWKSVYMYKPVDGLMKFGPLWDFDYSLGGPVLDADYYKYDRIFYTSTEWFSYIVSNPKYIDKVKEEWAKVSLNINKLITYLYNYYQVLAPYGDANMKQWPVVGFSSPYSKFATFELYYNSRIELLKQRNSFLDEHFKSL